MKVTTVSHDTWKECATVSIVVGKVGAVQLKAHEEFDRKYKQEHGYLPFWKRHKWITSGWKKLGNGVTEIGECPVTQEEINDYVRQRNEYIAEEILHKCGWVEFVRHCEYQGIEDLISKHAPCEADDRQCHIDCPIRLECQP